LIYDLMVEQGHSSSSGDLESKVLCFICLYCLLSIFLVIAAAILAFVFSWWLFYSEWQWHATGS